MKEPSSGSPADLHLRFEKLERIVRLYHRVFAVLACLALLSVTLAFAPFLLQDPEAFKITTPNGSSSPTTRIQVSGNENTAQIGVLNSNMGVGTSTQFGSGVGVVGLANATTNPSTNPTGGGVMYSEGGQLKWRRSDGTIDVLGAGSDTSAREGLAQCRLDYQSTTQVRLNQFNGRTLDVNGSLVTVDGTAVTDQLNSTDNLITSTGADAASAMAASTLYYIYRSNSSATTFSNDLRGSTTAPSILNGVRYLGTSGNAANWRFVGYVRTNISTQFDDSDTKRNVISWLNRRPKRLKVFETADTWTYGSASWRSWNNSTSNRVEFISNGVDLVVLRFDAMFYASTSYTATIGIDLDGTSTNDADTTIAGQEPGSTTYRQPLHARYEAVPAEGHHFLQLMENALSGLTVTYLGDNGGPTSHQSGALGWVMG